MAYNYAEEIIGLKEEIKKYGGTKIDLGAIADKYDPNRTIKYPKGDLVIYDGDLWKAGADLLPMAGEWNSSMWDLLDGYDSTQTYYQGQQVVVGDRVYDCLENGVTGEWDASKWEDVTESFETYDPNSRLYFPYGQSKCEYDGAFYRTNGSYTSTGSVGEFNILYWTPTSVEQLLVESKTKIKITHIKSSEGGVPTLITDANGIVKLNISNIQGEVIGFYANFMQPMTQFNTEIIYCTKQGTRELWLKFTDRETGDPLANTELHWYMNYPSLVWVAGSDMEFVDVSVTQVADV